MESNWFASKLPIEVKQRAYDEKWNVWHMHPIRGEDGSELKWCVIGVFDTEQEAKDFASKRV